MFVLKVGVLEDFVIGFVVVGFVGVVMKFDEFDIGMYMIMLE